jgi:hypothetical protein
MQKLLQKVPKNGGTPVFKSVQVDDMTSRYWPAGTAMAVVAAVQVRIAGGNTVICRYIYWNKNIL